MLCKFHKMLSLPRTSRCYPPTSKPKCTEPESQMASMSWSWIVTSPLDESLLFIHFIHSLPTWPIYITYLAFAAICVCDLWKFYNLSGQFKSLQCYSYTNVIIKGRKHTHTYAHTDMHMFTESFMKWFNKVKIVKFPISEYFFYLLPTGWKALF